MQHEIDGLLLARLLGIAGDGYRIGRAGEARTWLDDVAHQKADDECKRRDDLEVDEGFDTDAPNLLGALDMGDAGHDGAEDDRRDHHSDQLDETVSKSLDPIVLGEIRE